MAAHVAGRFREPTGFQQSASGQYYVFDRRAHTVFGLDERQSSTWEIVRIGGEPGRIIDPTAFACEPGGSFVVADAPNNRERIQIFTRAGARIGGFTLPGRLKTRVWVAFVVPYTYVYDREGDKARTVQFRGAGVMTPGSLFFGKNGRLLVTPGLYEFEVGGATAPPVH